MPHGPLHPWRWWTIGGAVTGAAVVSVVGFLVQLVDFIGTGMLVSGDLNRAVVDSAVVALWAAAYGAVGGLLVGLVCAIVGRVTRWEWSLVTARYLATMLALLPSVLFSALIAFAATIEADSWPLAFGIYFVVPVVAVAAASWWSGACIWQRSHRFHPAA